MTKDVDIKSYLTPIFRVFVAVFAIILLIAAYLIGWEFAGDKYDKELSELVNESARLHKEVEVTNNKYSTASKAIQDLSDENTQLIDLVADLRVQANKPPIIKEVIKVVTVIEPSDPVYITPNLPDEHKFKLSPGLEVARFSKVDGQYKFETHKLTVKNSIVVGEDKSSALLQIASSVEPDVYYEIPIDDLQVRSTDEKLKLFRPDIMLSIRAGLSKNPELTAAVSLTLIHPKKCIDTVGVSVAGNSKTAQFGIIPFAYNIGCHLPVVNDLWIVTDGYVDVLGQFGAGLGIGTKF
jgi:hypothetical protein